MTLSINTCLKHTHKDEDYNYSLEISTKHWSDYFNILHVCQLTDLEVEESLDLVKQYKGRVSKSSGMVFFKEKCDAIDFMNVLD